MVRPQKGTELPEDLVEVYDSVLPVLEIAKKSKGMPIVGCHGQFDGLQTVENYEKYTKDFANGTADTVDEISGFEEKIKTTTEIGLKSSYVRTFDGGEVDVAGFLSGRRDCYIRRRKIEQSVATVFVVGIALSCRWKKHQLENRMASIIGLMETYRIQKKPIQMFIMLTGRLSKGRSRATVLFEVTNSDRAKLLQYGSEKFYRLTGWAVFETIFKARFYDSPFNIVPIDTNANEKKAIESKTGASKIIFFGYESEPRLHDTIEGSVKTVADIHNGQFGGKNERNSNH